MNKTIVGINVGDIIHVRVHFPDADEVCKVIRVWKRTDGTISNFHLKSMIPVINGLEYMVPLETLVRYLEHEQLEVFKATITGSYNE